MFVHKYKKLVVKSNYLKCIENLFLLHLIPFKLQCCQILGVKIVFVIFAYDFKK